jgi:hypothetical protein
MAPLTKFERFILSQPVPSLDLPALNQSSDVDLWERADILLYGGYIARGDENLRRVAMVAGILPASPEEIKELAVAGY